MLFLLSSVIRVFGDAAASQQCLRPPGAGRGRKFFLHSPECGPADTLILDFWFRELWEQVSIVLGPQVCDNVTEALRNSWSCIYNQVCVPELAPGMWSHSWPEHSPQMLCCWLGPGPGHQLPPGCMSFFKKTVLLCGISGRQQKHR